MSNMHSMCDLNVNVSGTPYEVSRALTSVVLDALIATWIFLTVGYLLQNKLGLLYWKSTVLMCLKWRFDNKVLVSVFVERQSAPNCLHVSKHGGRSPNIDSRRYLWINTKVPFILSKSGRNLRNASNSYTLNSRVMMFIHSTRMNRLIIVKIRINHGCHEINNISVLET